MVITLLEFRWEQNEIFIQNVISLGNIFIEMGHNVLYTRINFNTSMDKELHAQENVGWNYFSNDIRTRAITDTSQQWRK